MTGANNTPFFVLGSQRSGTTMLRLMLNRHSRLAVPHESKFIMAFYPRLAEYGPLSDHVNAARLLEDISQHKAVRDGGLICDRRSILAYDVASYRDLVEAIMSEKARAMGKIRWGDKTPYYISHIDELWTIFPEAKVVHLVRDGRDVVVSQRRMEWMSSNLARLAHDWWWKTTLCHKVGSVRGNQFFMEIKYEHLVQEPEATIRKICEFLCEDYEPEMLEFNAGGREEVPEGSLKWHRSSVEAPDPSKLGRWRTELSRADRVIFEQNAGEALDLFDYPREHMRSTFRSRVKNLYYSSVVRW